MQYTFSLFLLIVTNYMVVAQSDSEFSSSRISIGVVVSDLDKSVDFYSKIIGMKKTGSFSVNEETARRSGLSGGIPFDVTVLKLEDSAEATEWKLLSFSKKAQHPVQNYIQDDTGVQYITLFVKSLRPFLERIQRNNISFLGDTPIPLGEDRHFVLIQDPDGTFIELIGALD